MSFCGFVSEKEKYFLQDALQVWNACGTPALLCIKFVEERGVEGEVNTPAKMTDVRKVKLGMLLDSLSDILDWKNYCFLDRRNTEPCQ